MAKPDKKEVTKIVKNWFKVAARDGQGEILRHTSKVMAKDIQLSDEDILKSARQVDFNGDIDTLEVIFDSCKDRSLGDRILSLRLQNFKRIGWREKEDRVRDLIRKKSLLHEV